MTTNKNILLTLAVCTIELFSLAQTTLPDYPVDSTFNIKKTFSINELHSDLAILKAALVKCHPGLYWHQPEKEFEAKYN